MINKIDSSALRKLHLLWNTVRYLKYVQIIYRLYYALRSKINPNYRLNSFKNIKGIIERESFNIKLNKELVNKDSCISSKGFKFLNISKTFEKEIEWNFDEFGKLWTYNLNYFDYLQQKSLTKESGELLIRDFINKTDELKDGLEPYPTSLRIINWVKFLSRENINDTKINIHLYCQIELLKKDLEYHILGNHLLENGYALMFGAYYFNDKDLYNKSKRIIVNELNEQTLNDGAHFELSPMYHQILLDRLLDTINLIKNNARGFKLEAEFEAFLVDKSELMLGWLKAMTFSNGDIPLMNDSTLSIAPSSQTIFNYASIIGVNFNDLGLNDSGYRRFNGVNYESIIDVGQVGPSYQPGHAHADTFNYVLYVNRKPFIIDPGISTYEKNATRQAERSTCYHNTLVVGDKNSTNVWGGFRVAERAEVTVESESVDQVMATHNGYRSVIHKREFTFNRNQISIKDSLSIESNKSVSHLHFSPSITPELDGDKVIVDNVKIEFKNAQVIKLRKYKCPNGYNQYADAWKLTFEMKNESETIITIQD